MEFSEVHRRSPAILTPAISPISPISGASGPPKMAAFSTDHATIRFFSEPPRPKRNMFQDTSGLPQISWTKKARDLVHSTPLEC